MMATPDSDQWRTISPYLDQALGMSEDEQSVWLSGIHLQDPGLAGQLQSLLAENRALSEEGFLENRSVPLPSAPGLIGQAFGQYRLTSQIGQGGMGSVWLAERSDGSFDRQVAVKCLNIALIGKVGEERFRREGRILGRLAHPNIAELLDAGVSAFGQPYLVLEYIEGQHLDRFCDARRLDVEARIRLFLDVLTAVAHAHSNLIVHRDIKPSNVLVGTSGQVKLLDFSIAKLLEADTDASAATLLTVEGARAMTPEYAAPEQLKGEAITTATDIYALGVLLYVLLTGRHPAGSGPHTPVELVGAIEKEPIRPSDAVFRGRKNDETAMNNATLRDTVPNKLQRVLRRDLDTILVKALKKDRSERYSSATAFADDLRRYLRNQPISARPDTFVYRTAKFVRRNRTAVLLSAIALLVTFAGVVVTIGQARAARSQRDFAFQQLQSSEILNEFHEFLLSDAAPSGKPFTTNELLDRAKRIVERERVATDPNRLRLLISIGYQYLEQDEADKGRQVLEEAYRLSLSSSEVSIRAKASCVFGAALARVDELSRAETLFQEGIREIPEGPQFTLERIACLRSGTEIAVQSGNAVAAVRRAQTAQTVLRNSPFDSGALELERWIDLATAYSSAGQHAEAVAAFQEASVLLTSLGRDQTEDASAIFCNWALELDTFGRPRDAESMYRRAIDIERAGHSEEEVSPILLVNYSRTLQELGRFKEASSYAARAYVKAQRIGYSLAANCALLERARIQIALKQTSQAASTLDALQPRLQRGFPAGHYAFASFAALRGLNALAAGDLESAQAFADQAVSIVEAAIKSGREGSHELPTLLANRSTIELAASHPDHAAADARRAVTLLEPTVEAGKFSSTLGYAYLALGRALRAEGEADGARGALRLAAEHLQNAVGPDHPDARIARQLAESSSSGHSAERFARDERVN
ncbi:MAG TPA: serine/threonine-protein kinase [Candidatus Sulfotelmatobacter sp.]|nr:serine/threonine-protein kinase [Candidatus Sulfotelmatobacter sp.]